MHKLHTHGLHAKRRPAELTKLYWSQVVTTLGGGLVAIFIPLFLLSLGYSLGQVFLYMVFYGLFGAFTIYLAVQLVVKIGANRTMAIANVCQAIFMVLLITLPTHHWPLFALAALIAFVNSAYWAPFHANFALTRTPSKAGRQLSYFYVLTAAAGALAPAVGGILATIFDITLAYAIAAAVFVIAAVPMFWGVEAFKPVDFKLKRLKETTIKPDLMAYSGWAVIETVEIALWPIIIFLLVASYATVGLASSVLIITGILTTLYVGRREEVKGEKHYIRQGSATTSLTNFGRVFASGSPMIFGMNLLSGISFHLLSVSFFTRFYKHVGNGHTLEYLFAMESLYNLSLVAFYLLLFGLTFIVPVQVVLTIGLLLTIPASYLATRIR